MYRAGMWLLGALFFSASSWAGVYKCTVNGVTTYSETACGSDAAVVAINDASVTFDVGMPTADIDAFCVLLMRAYDRSLHTAQVGGFYDHYGRGGSEHEDPYPFIVGHVANLASLHLHKPELYNFVYRLASVGDYKWRRRAYAGDADRQQELEACRSNVISFLDSQRRIYD